MKIRSVRLLAILISLAFGSMVFASPVMSLCSGGGGEEGVAAVDVSPSNIKVRFLDVIKFTVKNTGTKTFTSMGWSIIVTKGTPSAFTEVGSDCLSKLPMGPGATCTIEVQCNQWEADAKLNVATIPTASDSSTMNSTP